MANGDVLVVIPARGSSRGIPRKNARPFLGRPLLAWAVEAACESGVADRVVVSTDDEELAEIGRAAGAEVPFLRPAELATDDAPTAPAIAHAVEQLGWSGRHVVILEPTSPARRPFHLREAVGLLARTGADSLASVSPIPHHFVPSKALALLPDGTIEGVTGTPIVEMRHARQDLEQVFAFDGVVFACRTELLRRAPATIWGERVLGYRVDRRYAIDLDEPDDWEPAEARLRKILEDEGESG